ncbi:MAG: hypothetical protein AABM66_09080 [Actinomycetota bacterium]
MKTAAIVTLSLILLVVGGAAAFWGHIRSEHTLCFAYFQSRDAAERAASGGHAAGFDDVEVEAVGPDARLPTSKGGRAISVDFTTGETGGDATSLRQEFREIVEGEGAGGAGCVEHSRMD